VNGDKTLMKFGNRQEHKKSMSGVLWYRWEAWKFVCRS